MTLNVERLVEQTFVQKAKITILDEVRCIVSGLHPDHADIFYEKYGFHVEGYFFQPKYKLGVWDGKTRFFTPEGRTYVNLLEEIIPIVKSLGYKIELNDKRIGHNAHPPLVDAEHFSHIINPKTGMPYEIRPYQVDGVNSLISEGFGVLVAGTAAGKTLINATLVDAYGQQGLRTITIVPAVTLISQTRQTFDDLGLDVGEYSGEVKDTNHTHVVSTWQSLQNNPKIIKDFDVVVVDECHGAKSKVINELINDHGKHIVHRFGLTGTIPKPKADAKMIEVSLGPVRYEVQAHTLITAGWLAKPNITILQLDDVSRFNQIMETSESDDGQKQKKIMYDSETSFLQRDSVRRVWIAEFIKEKGAAHKGNVLCLVTNVSVGKKLSKQIPGSIFLYGSDKQAVRKQVYELFETHNNIIVIATVQIAGVGLSIDRIFNLIYIDGGKSFVRTIQSIGRGLRKGKDKDSVDVIDICGNLEYSKKHLASRVKYYKGAKYQHKKLTVSYI